jgi:DNA polymerase III subunit delta
MVTTLTGNNTFQLRTALKKLTAEFVHVHGDLALEKLDGEEATYEQVLGAIESLPFLASKKMVVVHDLSANKQAAESFEQLNERAGETTDLVIVEARPDKRSTYFKQLKKLTDFHEFKEMDEAGLAGWLVQEAEIKGGELSRTDAQYLVRRVGINQMRMSRELEKLIHYDAKVTRRTIDLLTDESPSSTIFNLVDSAFSGDLKNALKLYDEQRKQRVEPQAIHGMLVWQMHAVAVTSAAPGNITPDQIAKDSGLSPYVVQKSQRIARQMGRQKILEFMKLLRDIDYRGKHEAMDYDEALRFVIVQLAS